MQQKLQRYRPSPSCRCITYYRNAALNAEMQQKLQRCSISPTDLAPVTEIQPKLQMQQQMQRCKSSHIDSVAGSSCRGAAPSTEMKQVLQRCSKYYIEMQHQTQ